MPDADLRRPYLLDIGSHRELVDLVRFRGSEALVRHKGRTITVSRKNLEKVKKRHVLPQ